MELLALSTYAESRKSLVVYKISAFYKFRYCGGAVGAAAYSSIHLGFPFRPSVTNCDFITPELASSKCFEISEKNLEKIYKTMEFELVREDDSLRTYPVVFTLFMLRCSV